MPDGDGETELSNKGCPYSSMPLPNEMVVLLIDAIAQINRKECVSADTALPFVLPIFYGKQRREVHLVFLIYHSKPLDRMVMQPSPLPGLHERQATDEIVQELELEPIVRTWAEQLGLTYQPVKCIVTRHTPRNITVH